MNRKTYFLFCAFAVAAVVLQGLGIINTPFPFILFPLFTFGTSSSSSKPNYMPGQKQGYQDLLAMAMNALGVSPAATSSLSSTTGTRGKSGYLYNPLNRGTDGGITPSAGTSDYFARLGTGYGGDFVAPQNENEKWGMEQMRALIEGGYDPRNSDFYKGMREGAYENLDKSLTGTRQSAALGGMLGSTRRIDQEGQLQRQTANDLNTLLGGMYETERGRIQSMLPIYQEAAGVEREIAQLGLDKEYQEFIRQLNAMGIPLEVALRLITQQPGQSSSSSGFEIGATYKP